MTQTFSARQADLFEPILDVYRSSGSEEGGIANADLYRALGVASGERLPVGASGEKHNLEHRQVRWQQQTLRQLGLIERVPGRRGAWRLTPKKDLTPAEPGVKLLAFSTNLGLAIWGRCEDVFPDIDEPVHLCLTSPPYPLQRARDYGGPTEAQFVDFIVKSLEPIVKNLAAGGSVVLQIGNDIFMPKSPARSMYVERTVLAMHDKLGLQLMDRLIWENPSKPPGPTWWACRERVQLAGKYEHALWFTNDPSACFADNRRVLQPHSKEHLALLARGGETRVTSHGNGAFQLRKGSFSNPTAGKIASNVMRFANGGGGRAAIRRVVKEAGLPTHSAPMPRGLARFLIEFLTERGMLVVEPFAGEFNVPREAEATGRRWIGTEMMGEHAAAGSLSFRDAPGFKANFTLTSRDLAFA